jgi:hypothetical protein
MFKILVLVAAIVTSIAAFHHPVSAQPMKQQAKIAPLIIEIDGDLVSWDGTNAKRLTNWGGNSEPILSPDGKYVAYKSLPQFVMDDMRKNGGRSGIPPSNFWVMEIATENAFRIADQPPDARFAEFGKDEKFTLRPLPAWSPDSKSLAWGEIIGIKQNADKTYAGYDQRLVVYDLVRKSQKVIVRDMLANEEITDGDRVSWGERGLVYFLRTNPPLSDTIPSMIIYSADGKQRTEFKVEGVKVPNLTVWIKDNGKDFILVMADTVSESILIDPDMGKQTPLPGKLELYSTTAPNGIRIFYDGGWNIDDPRHSITKIGKSPLMAISPDGTQVVYRNEDLKVMYYHDGKSALFPLEKGEANLASFVWGPTAYRIRR